LKENVIIGRKIPVGTGAEVNQVNSDEETLIEDIADDLDLEA
jgi:hypothetical protein